MRMDQHSPGVYRSAVAPVLDGAARDRPLISPVRELGWLTTPSTSVPVGTALTEATANFLVNQP
jgi:hypothetical protein